MQPRRHEDTKKTHEVGRACLLWRLCFSLGSTTNHLIQTGAMTPRFVSTKAANGNIDAQGERRKELNRLTGRRLRQLALVRPEEFSANQGIVPVETTVAKKETSARGHDWKPHVEITVTLPSSLRHTTGWPAGRANPQALASLRRGADSKSSELERTFHALRISKAKRHQTDFSCLARRLAAIQPLIMIVATVPTVATVRSTRANSVSWPT